MSLSWLFVRVLTILSESENGIFLVTVPGWILDVNRYWFLAIFFLNKSISISPFCYLQKVSRNEIESFGPQLHLFSSASDWRLVCSFVNWIYMSILFICSRSTCVCFVIPFNIRNRSSKKRFNNKSNIGFFSNFDLFIFSTVFTIFVVYYSCHGYVCIVLCWMNPNGNSYFLYI